MSPSLPRPMKYEALPVAIHKTLRVQELYGEDAPDRIMTQKAVYEAVQESKNENHR